MLNLFIPLHSLRPRNNGQLKDLHKEQEDVFLEEMCAFYRKCSTFYGTACITTLRPKIIKVQRIFISSLEDSHCRAAVYQITLDLCSTVYCTVVGGKQMLRLRIVVSCIFAFKSSRRLEANGTMLNDHFYHGGFAFGNWCYCQSGKHCSH